jgi:hypothetical protein
MDDKSSESKPDARADKESPEKTFPIEISVDDLSYLLDRLVIIGWVLTTPLWLAGYYSSTLWISYGLALLTLLDVILHFSRFHIYQRSVTWLVFILIALVGYFETRTWSFTFQSNQQVARENETHGWLVPADDPMPAKNPCEHFTGSAVPQDARVPHDALFFHFGPLVYWYEQNEVIQRKILIAIRGNPLLAFSKNGDKLVINGDVLDANGEVVAVIDRDNEFHLVGGKYAYSERPDLSTLRVVGLKKQELLYIRFANANTIVLRGIFPIPDKSKMPEPFSTETFDITVPYPARSVVISDAGVFIGPHVIGANCTHSFPENGILNLGQ